MDIALVISSGRCLFDPAYVKPPAGDQTRGIRCYSKVKGIFLQAFGIAYEIKDKDRVVHYLNKYDLQAWTASYGHQVNSYKETKVAIKAIIAGAHASHWIAKGEQYRKKTTIKEAIHCYTKALKYNPRNPKALIARALSYRQQKKFTQAIADCSLTINSFPNYSYAWAVRGDSYRMLQDYEIAVQDLEQALKLDPQSSFAAASLAECYRSLGDTEAAVRFAHQALAIDPDNEFGLMCLSNTYLDIAEKFQLLQNYDEALKVIQEALNVNPTYPRAKTTMVETLHMRTNHWMHFKNHIKAIDDLTEILKFLPTDEEALLKRASCYQNLRQEDLAVQDFELALSHHPASAAVQTKFSEFCKYEALNQLEKKNYNRAKYLFDLYLKMNPNDVAMCCEMGDCLSYMRNYKQALMFYSKAAKIDPTDYKSHLRKGSCALNSGKFEKALRAFTVATKLDEKPTQAWKGLGESYGQLQRFAEAVQCFQKASACDPKDAELYFQCAQMHQSIKNYSEAMDCCNKALAINPSFTKASILRDSTFQHVPLWNKLWTMARM